MHSSPNSLKESCHILIHPCATKMISVLNMFWTWSDLSHATSANFVVSSEIKCCYLGD